VRFVLSLLLVSLLASCPVLCGSAGEVLGLHCEHTKAHAQSATPGPIPANDDDCVCNGALLHCHADLRVADLNPDALPFCLDATCGEVLVIQLRLIALSDPHALPNGQVARGISVSTLLPVARC
jgi:hypothetical protein